MNSSLEEVKLMFTKKILWLMQSSLEGDQGVDLHLNPLDPVQCILYEGILLAQLNRLELKI